MLKDIRVIDFSQYLPGPFATLRLTELGAEVIKVESPDGDPGRYPLQADGSPRITFLANNRNKKSVVLNLKEEADQLSALELIREADVVIESFRPGVMKRLGIDYENVMKINPSVVYCSLSGYGQKGCMHQLGSHDINYMALSGLLAQMKDDQGKPIQPSMTFADLIGGISANESILAALVHREKTGKGAYLDISITDAATTLMTNHVIVESSTGEQHGLSKIHKKHVCYFIYETKDNRFISLGALEPKFWNNFCMALNKPEWINTHFSAPTADNPVFLEIQELFLSRTFEEWTKFSLEVDCCMAPILETGEVWQHPYIKERGLVQEKEGLRVAATRYIEDGSSLDTYSPAPKHGEHQKEISILQEHHR
ncbi:CaiB/BaiF CoA transferase family protein [Peribacillus frigoritolerans]|uniref:CaiB/BaiF CoA transferase family protein n=1 Tax=Peribacillus frigoritolerans TaxID=450367 RepID=UPI0020C040DF|nr:CoA transferase [Peribacillus frigoritolerans]